MANIVVAFPVSAGIEITGLAPGQTVLLSVVDDQIPAGEHYVGTVDDSAVFDGGTSTLEQLTPAAIVGSTVVGSTITPNVGTYTASATTQHFLAYTDDDTLEEVVFAEDFIDYTIPLALWEASADIRLGVTVTLGEEVETFYSPVSAVTIAPPIAVGTIPAQSYAEDDGDKTVDPTPYVQVVGDSALTSVTWAVIGEGATIDASTGLVTITTADARVTPITVTAANVTGSALLPFTVTIATPPAAADQTILMGALTPNAKGAAQARDGDDLAINITSIDSQPSTRWELSSGKIRPTGSPAMVSEQITCTVGGESVTINMVVVPNMISVADATEFAAVSMTPATTGDFTIQLRAGVLITKAAVTSKLTGTSASSRRALGGTLTLVGELEAGLPTSNVEGGNIKYLSGGKLVLLNLKNYPQDPALQAFDTDNRNGLWQIFENQTTDVVIDGMHAVGNPDSIDWPGVTVGTGGANNTDVDPWGALIRVNNVTGTLRPFIDGQIGDPDIITFMPSGERLVVIGCRPLGSGNYELQLANSRPSHTGVGDSEAGNIDGDNNKKEGRANDIGIGDTGTGLDDFTCTVISPASSPTPTYSSGPAYTYMIRSRAWLSTGRSLGDALTNQNRNLTIRNCDVSGFAADGAINPAAIDTVIIEQNKFHHISADFIKIANKTGANFRLIMRRNDLYSSLASVNDYFATHVDYLQIVGPSGGQWYDARIHHNRFLCNARGDGQGIFNVSGSNTLINGQMFGNILAVNNGGWMVYQNLTTNSQFCLNTGIINQKVAGYPPNYQPRSPMVFRVDSSGAASNIYVGWNISRSWQPDSVKTEKNFGLNANTSKTMLEMVQGLGGGRPLWFETFDDVMEGCVTILAGADEKAGAVNSLTDWSQYPYRVTTDDSHLPFTLDYEPGTAPEATPFTLTSPDAVGIDGTTFEGSVTVNVAGGVGSWVLCDANATAPDEDQVIAGTDGDDVAGFSSGTFSVATVGAKTFEGAAAANDWHCYMTQRSGPLTAPVVDSGEFNIAALAVSNPTAIAVGSSGWSGTLDVATTAGSVYWVRVTSTADAPTAAQVVAGTDGDDVAAAGSGNSTAVSGTQDFSGTSGSGTFKVYYAQKSGVDLSNVAATAAFTVSASGATTPVSLFTPVTSTGNDTTTTESAVFTPTAGQPIVFIMAATNHTEASAEMVRTVTIGASGRGVGLGTVLTPVASANSFRANCAAYVVDNPAASPVTVRIEWTSAKRACMLYGFGLPNIDTTDAVGATLLKVGLSNSSTLTNTLTTTAANSLALHAVAIHLDTAISVSGAAELEADIAGSGSNVVSACVSWATQASIGDNAAVHTWAASGSRTGVSVEFLAAAAAVPANLVLPAISGTGLTGSSHTVTTGDWSGSPTSYAYQWKDDGVNVGTNANAYTPVTTGALTCVVTATNAVGAGTPATSAAATITAGVPVNSVAPVVSGPLLTDSSHTCSTGTWSGTPTSYSYQWKDDGVNVGTDSSSYTPVTTGTLTCVVTASNAAGAGTPTSSAGVTISAPASFEPVSLFTTYSDSATGSTVRETATFTPAADHPIAIVVHALQESSASRAIALKVTIGAAGRGVGTGTVLTQAIQGNNGRVNTAIYVIDGEDVVASASTIQVSFDDGVNADSARCVIINGWRFPGGATASALGATGAAVTPSNGQSLTPSVTTLTNGSLVLYAGTVQQLTANITIATANATEIYNGTTGTANATDLVAAEAWEAAPTAGAQSVNWTWTGFNTRQAIGVEIKAA
jgi:hypothetical protein